MFTEEQAVQGGPAVLAHRAILGRKAVGVVMAQIVLAIRAAQVTAPTLLTVVGEAKADEEVSGGMEAMEVREAIYLSNFPIILTQIESQLVFMAARRGVAVKEGLVGRQVFPAMVVTQAKH
jgi:hypothetical protein